MKKIIVAVLIGLAVMVVAAGLFFAGTMFARSRAVISGVLTSGNDFDQEYYGSGPGMMNRRGSPGLGRGIRPGFSMMRSWRRDYGTHPRMMGGYFRRGDQISNLDPLSVEQARQAADNYIDTLDVEGLATGEVMIFDNHAYVIVEETASGMGAFELLVDPVNQVAYPEHGPNMMWNLKYGGINHTGRMGGGGPMGMMRYWNSPDAVIADVPAEMPVALDKALVNAQAYLDQYLAGAVASNEPARFYGYYTFDFTRDSGVSGMLSVNGYNGQVFLHTWHGKFIEESE